MYGTSKHSTGFSLIELMVALGLIALLATIVIPRIRKPREQDVFVRQLNALLHLAYNHALVKRKIQRLFFDFKNNSITLEEEQPQRSVAGERVFKPVSIDYLKTTMKWPSNFVVRSFTVNEKVDQGPLNTIYFIIMPDGFSQRVTIAIEDTSENTLFSLILNPFLLRFTIS